MIANSRIRTADGELSYADYLQTPEWRERRNAALHRARWRCQRCGRAGRRDVPLEVHHRTYERLGAELPADLEVLCIDCHRGETTSSADGGLRLALKVARECLHAQPFATIADLSEAVKVRCARLGVRLDPHEVQKAVGLVTAQRFDRPDVVDRADEPRPESAPVSADEARQILARLRANVAKQMPKARHVGARERECHRALGIVMQAIADQAERCADLEAAAIDLPRAGETA